MQKDELNMISNLSHKFFVTITVFLMIVSTTSCGAVTPVPTPINIPTKTSIPTSTKTPVPTITNTPTLVAYPVYGYDVLPSPDGTKKAIYDAHLGNTFEVIDKNGNILWSITYDMNKFNDEGYQGGLAEAWYKPFYWSKDGRFLYYTCFHGQEIDTSGKFWGNEFIDGCGVFRLNLETGETIDILPEIYPGNGYYAFSISHDENFLVYTYQNDSPVQIKLLDLNTGEERILLTASKDVLETGRYSWSPQGDKLIFMTLTMSEDEKRLYSIFILDLNSLETRLLIKDIDTRIRFLSWNEQDTISYDPDDSSDIWQLSIESGTFVFVTPTPWVPSITPTP